MRTTGLLALLTLTGCFAGYDSRWGQSAETQRQHAATHAPTLRGESAPEEKDATPVRTLRVRAYVTRAYASQVVDVTRTLRDLFDDADDVTRPAFHVRFELESTKPWELASHDDLEATLAALRKEDAAKDVDFVVGLVGSLPRATTSFHDLGIGALPGRHVVLRAASSAEKHDELDRLYADLSAEERRKVQRDHRRHRQAAVFLHEIGHTLGAIHERSEESLMFPQYRPRMTTFGPEASRVMRVVLAKRDAKTAEEQAVLYRELEGALRTIPANVIYEEERSRFLPQLESIASKASTAASAAKTQTQAPPAQPEPADLDKLAAEDRERFTRAKKLLHEDRDYVKAWETAKPLYKAYPDVRSVQDFRCKLATNVYRFEVARRECDRLMAIDMAPAR